MAMPKKTSVHADELSQVSVPAFWPMAMATKMFQEGAALYSKNLRFIDEEIKIHGDLRPISAGGGTSSDFVRADGWPS